MCYVNLCRFLVLPVFPRLFWCLSTPFNESLRWFGCSRDWIFFLRFCSKSFKPFETNQNDIFCGQNLVQLGITIYWSGSQKWRGGPVNWSGWETPWLVTILWTSLYMIQCTSSYMFLFEQDGYCTSDYDHVHLQKSSSLYGFHCVSDCQFIDFQQPNLICIQFNTWRSLVRNLDP